jgi:hypothetical protein
VEDLYVVLPATDPTMMAAQTATLQIVVNPLVNWIWLRVRHHGVRHRHRDAAGARVLVQGPRARRTSARPRRSC